MLEGCPFFAGTGIYIQRGFKELAEDASKKYAYLNQTSTEELNAILRASFLSEETDDPALIDYILEVIARRETEDSNIPDAGQARKEFDQLYCDLSCPLYPIPEAYTADTDGPRLNPKRRTKKILIAAAIVAALVSLTCVPVLGYPGVFQMIFAYWTDDYYTFGSHDAPGEQAMVGQPAEVPSGFVNLYNTMVEQGIDKITIPRYIPAGLRVGDSVLFVSPKTGGIDFSIQYQSDDDFLMFVVTQTPTPSEFIVEKDADSLEPYLSDGIEYHLFSNNGLNTATWNIDDLEYIITSSMPVTTLKEIIDSIDA